jgi:transcriptional regulator with XRE-family HTH domain
MAESSCVMGDKALRPKWNGAALRKHREALGWSVERLAKALGMENPGLIYKWEAGDSMPKADWLAALVLVLDQPAIRFFTGLDEYQARLPGMALSAREKPVYVEGEDTGIKVLDVGLAARAASRESAVTLPPASAKTASEPKRARRSPKRRP